MTNRSVILAHITADVAERGTITGKATRLYCENRISRADFDAACKRGIQIHKHALMNNAAKSIQQQIRLMQRG